MTDSESPPSWKRKFAVAWAGIRGAWKSQVSLRIHGLCAGLVLALAAVCSLTPLEWAVLLLVIGLVISLEIMNTAIEAVVDLCSPEHSELARIAKDAAAGAVLVAAIIAVGVGACIFVPALWSL